MTLEYEIDRVLWELAVEAAGVGVFDWDLVTGVLTWDDRLLDLFGYDRQSFGGSIEDLIVRVHPHDRTRVTRAVQDAIDTCGGYEAEYRIVIPDGDGDGRGTVRWVGARGRAVCDGEGTAVRLLGVGFDTTAHRQAQNRVVEVLEAMPAGFCSLDSDWRIGYINAEAERLLGLRAGEAVGRVLWDLFPAASASEFGTRYRAAMSSRQPTSFDAYYPEPLDSWYEVRVWPVSGGLSVYFLDVTARRATQEQAVRAARRVSLLAEVTSELTATPDTEAGLVRLVQLLVPEFADWCILSLAEEGEDAADWRRGLHDLASWHVDEQLLPLVRRYAELRSTALTETSHIAEALRTGRRVTVTIGTEDDAAVTASSLLQPGPARALLEELAPRWAAVFPLRGRHRIIGLFSLFGGPGGPDLTDDDLDTVTLLADRAGLALDSARLYAARQRVAEELQRSLLTEPPQPDHVEIVVRYTAAAEAAQVGGDWYDAFLQPDGATVLVIGDVVGHDTAAAAAMGQLRGLLRGIAAHSGQGPADVLSGVDRVMQTLQMNTTATAVVARLEQDDHQRSYGGATLRWSNAGHPPPFVMAPDGGVTVLAGVDADLLLGVDPTSRRNESQVLLDRGMTVLLYTDGLVERRTQPLDEGLQRLRDTLAELSGCSLDALCDAVLKQLLPASPDDDVALVAIRLHPHNRPRPPEAGPRRVPPNVPDAPEVDPEPG